MLPIPPHVVISAVLDHGKTVIDYIKDVKHANEEQKKLLDEVVATQLVLARLDSYANDDDWKDTMEALVAPRGPLDQLKLELKRMETKLKPPTGRFSKAGKALVWHFGKDDVKKHFDCIERIKTLLTLALHNNHRSAPFKSLSNIRELTKALKEDMGSVKEMLKGKYTSYYDALMKDQRARLEDEESLKVVKWLSDLNFWAKQDDAFKRCQEGTGEWLLSDSIFRSWMDGDTTVLWCPGARTFLHVPNGC
jgi:hypothetical protein